MSFEFKLAFKYFRARRKSLARFTSAVAVLGIAAGVASLILAQSLARGFADEMRDKILANTAHISISAKDGGEISGWQGIGENLKTFENINEISPTDYGNAVLISETETSYAILKTQFSDFKFQNKEILIGKRLAEKLNLKIGDEAEIATLENQTPLRVAIAGVFETGLYDYDATWIVAAPALTARLRGRQEFIPTALNVSVKDIYQSRATAQKIRERLGESFQVVDWQEANRPLFAALALERRVALAIIWLIILIAALNITTTLALLVNERRLDIAILQTCGARARSLITVFLFEGLFLSLLGILLGLIFGLSGCFLANYFRIVSLSAEVYALNFVPLRPQISDVLLIVALAFLISLAATLVPAIKASRLKPLENLRRR